MANHIYYRFIEIYMGVAPLKTLLHQFLIIIKLVCSVKMGNFSFCVKKNGWLHMLIISTGLQDFIHKLFYNHQNIAVVTTAKRVGT